MDYYFVSNEEMDSMVESKKVVEKIEVHGNTYAFTRSEVERIWSLNRLCIFVVVADGLNQFIDMGIKMIPIHIDVNGGDPVLTGRLTDRGDDPSSIKKRVENAPNERRDITKNRHPVPYFIDNEDLEKAKFLLFSLVEWSMILHEQGQGSDPDPDMFNAWRDFVCNEDVQNHKQARDVAHFLVDNRGGSPLRMSLLYGFKLKELTDGGGLK